MTGKSYIVVQLEDGRTGYIAAAEVGTVYESTAHLRPVKGQPPRAIKVITVLLGNGNKLHVRGETLDTFWNKLEQALGNGRIHLVARAVFEDGQGGTPEHDVPEPEPEEQEAA